MDTLDYFEFIATPRIVYGLGSLERIGKVCQRLGCKKPFLVIDRVFVDAGTDKIIEKSMAAEGMPVCGMLTDIPPDSDLEIISKGYKQAAAAGADMLVALGGGSTLDTAKGLRVMLGMGGTLPEGVNVITKPLPPLVAVPTTAGTGSEATTAAVIRDKARGLKLGFTDPALIPSIALLDPKLTMTMPQSITAGTGMDAMAHAVESLHSTNSQFVSQGLALQAIRLIARSLPRALEDGGDLEARGEMMLAATMAGMAFSNTLVGMAHAAAHAAGAAFRIPHGTACGLFLPYVMEFNLDVSKGAYAEAARALGIDTAGMGDLEAARAAVSAIRNLHLDAGLPPSLDKAGVPRDGIETIMEKALKDGSMITNPKQPTPVQMKAFLTKVWLGEPPCGAHAPAVDAERKQAAQTPKPEQKKPAAKPADDIAPLDLSLDQMYAYYSKLFNALIEMPPVAQALAKSGIIVQFAYSNENWDKEALFTIDCSGGGIKLYTAGDGPAPQVAMRMSSDTAHRFWLQKLDLMTAINKQDIVLQGNLNEVMGLLPSILPGFAIYAQLEKERAEKGVPVEQPAEQPITEEQMLTTIRAFSEKLFSLPEVAAPLRKSGIRIRFSYFNETWNNDVVLTADCGQDPIAVDFGPTSIEPVVTMRMHSDTARAFWLQKLNIMSAITKGDIMVEGNINEAVALLPAIMPGFALFKEVDGGA